MAKPPGESPRIMRAVVVTAHDLGHTMPRDEHRSPRPAVSAVPHSLSGRQQPPVQPWTLWDMC